MGVSNSYLSSGRRLHVSREMATKQPALVAPSSGEDFQLAADGRTESIATRLKARPTKSRSTARERRHERRWIRDAQRGSGEALEALYRRHWPWAHRAAYLVVHDGAAAEDIAQEAFLAAVRALDRFDRRRPFGPWLHRIVVNRAIDWARARALRREAASWSRSREATRRVAGRDPRPQGRPPYSRTSSPPWPALARAPGGRRSPIPARVHAGRDRRDARASRGERSTRACAGRSTGWADCWRRTDERAAAGERLREAFVPEEGEAEVRGWRRRARRVRGRGTPFTSGRAWPAGDRRWRWAC